MARKKVTLPDMPEKFLQCRDLRHAWKTKGWYREARQLRRVLECIRCGTYRTDEFSRDGSERRSLGYSWPDGYLIQGEGRPTPPWRCARLSSAGSPSSTTGTS